MYTCPYTVSKPTKKKRPRVNCKGNHRLWMIMMYHCRFVNFNTCTTLVGMLTIREAMPVWGILETSVPSSKFCHEPKTALKNKESKIQVRGEGFPLP